MSNSATDNHSSQLLLWPRRRRRRRRPDDSGWVLGWTSNTANRQTVVCAGILPPTNKSLEEYRTTLKQLKLSSSSRELGGCTCLTQSLDIVAYWSGTTQNKNKNESNDDDTNSSNLPNIQMKQQGYPWWEDSSNNHNNAQHRQLLYYQQDQENEFAHFASEYGTSDWPILLNQLNHAQEILALVERGKKLPELPKGVVSPETPTNPNDDDDDDNDKPPPSTWTRLCHFVFTQSLTLLHFHQLFQEKASLLSCISWIRCLQTIPSRSTSSSGNNNHTCSHCGKPSLVPSRPLGAKRYVAEWDRFLSAAIDALLGVLVAIVLMTLVLRYASVGSFYLNAKQASLQILNENIAWLETFPAGFKLNVQLTHNMGHEIRNLIRLQQQFLDATLWNPQICTYYIVPLLAGLSAICGWTSFLAVVIDLWRLELLLLLLVFTISFRNLYSAELYLLSALWRLFRGKKRNVLRQRTDSMQYDATQLLVGTIGFCICIFLWTTLWAYYTFFVLANILLHLPLLLLWIMYITSRSIPWGSLVWRTKESTWFSKTVHLQLVKDDGHGPGVVRVTRLCSNAESHVHLLASHLLLHLKPLGKWWLHFCLEALMPRNANEAPCSMPFVTLLEGFSQTSDQNK